MTWVTKREYRESSAGCIGLTVNSAFLREIKEDHVEFRERLETCLLLATVAPHRSIRELTDHCQGLLDELETYFALEEFYGYFPSALEIEPSVSLRAHQLQHEHESLFLELRGLVELCERALYGEIPADVAKSRFAARFVDFYHRLTRHEQAEHQLLIQVANQELGVGD